MMNPKVTQQTGFTLIELLAVMAILAVLASMVAPAVTGTKEASVDAKTLANATQVRTAATDFFKDQTQAEVRLPHSVRTTAAMPVEDGVRLLVASPGEDVTATQIVSSRWPEKYITIGNDTADQSVTDTGATYSSVIPSVVAATPPPRRSTGSVRSS